jgi:hypothetical protein
VFSEVNRRKRTTMGGIGALGRNARYSCSKMGMNSALTKWRVAYKGTGTREQAASGDAPVDLDLVRRSHRGTRESALRLPKGHDWGKGIIDQSDQRSMLRRQL